MATAMIFIIAVDDNADAGPLSSSRRAIRRALAKFWRVVFDHFNPAHLVCAISCAKQFPAGTAGDGLYGHSRKSQFWRGSRRRARAREAFLKTDDFWLTGGFLRPRLQVNPQAAPFGPFPGSVGIGDDKTLLQANGFDSGYRDWAISRCGPTRMLSSEEVWG